MPVSMPVGSGVLIFTDVLPLSGAGTGASVALGGLTVLATTATAAVTKREVTRDRGALHRTASVIRRPDRATAPGAILRLGGGALAADVRGIYRNLRSSSAKNAAESRSNSSSVSLMGSPMWSFTIDRSGVSLICLSPRRTPLLFIKESHIILTSLSGFSSFVALATALTSILYAASC